MELNLLNVRVLTRQIVDDEETANKMSAPSDRSLTIDTSSAQPDPFEHASHQATTIEKKDPRGNIILPADPQFLSFVGTQDA